MCLLPDIKIAWINPWLPSVKIRVTKMGHKALSKDSFKKGRDQVCHFGWVWRSLRRHTQFLQNLLGGLVNCVMRLVALKMDLNIEINIKAI